MTGPQLLRVLAVNAAVFTAGIAALAVSPAPVRVPETDTELALLLGGVVAILLADLVALAVAVREPRETLAPVEHPPVVDSALWGIENFLVDRGDRAVGIVDEVLRDADGAVAGIVVSCGWLGRSRFFVPPAEVAGVVPRERRVTLR